mmetsp:Transcript_61109/g.115442  ORF Transcript_61109/g.115442 Transcript_61109/m.115442 type:complete len:357 (+) Transcript_61109:77-1147(+)
MSGDVLCNHPICRLLTCNHPICHLLLGPPSNRSQSLGTGRSEDGPQVSRSRKHLYTEEDLKIRIGSRVLVHGLQKKPELNGRKGYCTGRTDTGRWTVKMDSGEACALKPENLTDLDAEEMSFASGLRCLRPQETPNDIEKWLTTGAKHLARSSGKYYYEVKLLEGRIKMSGPQFGWLSTEFQEGPYDGIGVGDDIHGWATDGARHKVHHNGSREAAWPRTWQDFDIIGLAIDIEGRQMQFSLNGDWVPSLRMTFNAERNTSFYPALSMGGPFVMHIPRASWKFAPPDSFFKAWAESGSYARPGLDPHTLLPLAPSDCKFEMKYNFTLTFLNGSLIDLVDIVRDLRKPVVLYQYESF